VCVCFAVNTQPFGQPVTFIAASWNVAHGTRSEA